jgi:hypothetical protein
MRMLSDISEDGSSAGVRRGKMLITDIEDLKKTEINRRRRLRLEQVTYRVFVSALSENRHKMKWNLARMLRL